MLPGNWIILKIEFVSTYLIHPLKSLKISPLTVWFYSYCFTPSIVKNNRKEYLQWQTWMLHIRKRQQMWQTKKKTCSIVQNKNLFTLSCNCLCWRILMQRKAKRLCSSVKRTHGQYEVTRRKKSQHIQMKKSLHFSLTFFHSKKVPFQQHAYEYIPLQPGTTFFNLVFQLDETFSLVILK